jgi:hypothetical protein
MSFESRNNDQSVCGNVISNTQQFTGNPPYSDPSYSA